jgi:hypothetical protein
MGLAQEVKDFMAGYQAVTDIKAKKDEFDLKKKKTEHDMEYEDALLELKKQEMDLARQKLAQASGGSGGSGARPMTEYQKAQIELARERLELDRQRIGAASANAADADAEKRANAAIEGIEGTGTSFNQEDFDPSSAGQVFWPDDDEEEEVGAYNQGGLVKGDEEEPIVPPATPAPAATAAPVAAPAATPSAIPETPSGSPTPATAAVDGQRSSSPSDSSAAPESDPNPTKIVVRKSREAAKAAMDSFEREFSQPKQAVGGEESDIDFATGEGAMTPEEVESMRKTVDPNDQLSTHLKSAATLSAAYDYFMGKGQQEKAVRAAKGFLVAERRMTQTLGALTLQAFEDGNVNEACRLLNDACNRFPSGHKIEVTPNKQGVLVYQVSNEDGVVEQGRLSGDEFVEFATGVADGRLYTKMMMHFVSDAESDKGKSQSFGSALDDVNANYSALVQAQTALQSLGTDAPYAERKAAFDAVQQANAALESSRKAAIDLGEASFTGKGDRAAHEARVRNSVQSAMRSDENLAIPSEPEPDQPGLGARIKDFFTGGNEPDTPTGNASDAPTPPTASDEPVPVASAEQYAKLPSGTKFIAPDGTVRIKP